MVKTGVTLHSLLFAGLLASMSTPVPAADKLTAPNPTKSAYFGDLHLHTSLSIDAFALQTRTLPDDSYRFAQGQEVEYFGQRYKRKAPLDFLAVTDHSEFLGLFRQFADPKGPYAGTDEFKALHDPDPRSGWALLIKILSEGIQQKDSGVIKDAAVQSNWRIVVDAAEKYYQPGKFTTFVAYEWTSMPKSQNLHRNVIFRGPKFPARPFSSIDSERPEDLWAFLEKQRANGVQALAIPHNSNVSNGLMFDYKDSNGTPITRAYADTRLRNEPVVEVSQHKGTSETHPVLSPTDEFADFELYGKLLNTRRQGKIDGSYVRQAYARGLELAARVGANPYKFGLVGATDFHSGISATEESNFPGGLGVIDNSPKVVFGVTPAPLPMSTSAALFSAAGLTGVWAEANTREAIFDALKRKEVFATSGNRIQARLFGGWNFPKDLTRKANWVKVAYATGVAMGAGLPVMAGTNAPQARTPRFVVQAIKDPNAGNLDRIQIVKVWHQGGQSHEKVFDVVWSGQRAIDPKTGKLPPVGNTVDAKTATYKNTIGASELSGVWEDPEFNAAASAVYYARVLEIPTPRWTTYWAAKAKLPIPAGVPVAIQERAWTSPIFYKPA